MTRPHRIDGVSAPALSRRALLGILPPATVLAMAGCGTAVPVPGGSGGSPDGSEAAGDTQYAPRDIVLADAQPPGEYNPILGHGELGVSLLYDGLLALRSEGDERLPDFEPALAAELPRSNDDLTEWVVDLRPGVVFHDGSPLTADDVVATYRAVLDPAQASPIAAGFAMIESVEASPAPDHANDEGESGGGGSVTFSLSAPYADFASRLLLAIAPASRIGPGPASESELTRSPIGTGPYRLAELTGDQAVFTAFHRYWGRGPEVTEVRTVHVPDDNSRVQRVTDGNFHGTSIPPVMGAAFADRKDFEIVTARSADWRGVSLPRTSALTADPRVRLALNLAVDRAAMVETVQAGKGEQAHTPVSSVYPQHDPSAAFHHDPDRARDLLDAAGWTLGEDGVRTREGERAALTLAYDPDDTVRRDLATAFAADLGEIGVEVALEGMGFDRIEARIDELAILLGGGERPYSLDTQLHAVLHTDMPGTSVWDNPGNHGSDVLDDLLDRARSTADDDTRADLQRRIQQEYVREPSHVFLTFLHHTYAVRRDAWHRGPLVVEPHVHGVNWGPWWNTDAWSF